MPVFEEVRGGFMATIKRKKFMAIQKGHNVTSLVNSDERQKKIRESILNDSFISTQQIVVAVLQFQNRLY